MALADRYRIERELGQGGMATVYLAEDLKHKRKVALKVLKPELAAVLGAERFVQEITTTAALQHPHILPLFDSGTADSFLFYVMPFIDGETLRSKLDRETQLGVEEAVKITTEVADALHYAHQHGVIHRDIKPENILLANGRPMVADFGIALAVSAAAGGRMTETGLSLGTPHYMSPEQATAEKEITARSDVYSLASVLFEMLAGEPPHTGGSAQAIIMKIIAEPVELVTKHRKSVPPNVAAALAQALEKVPADRFGSASAFAQALADPMFGVLSGRSIMGGALGASAGGKRLTAALASIALVVSALATWALLRPVAEPPVSRFVVQLADIDRIVYGGVRTGPRLALTPDGRQLLYISNTAAAGSGSLLVRSLDQFAPQTISGTTNAIAPAVSWDGTLVAYADASSANAIRVVSLGGGPHLTLADTGIASFPAWGPDGFVYFIGSGGTVRRVSGSGGPIETVLTLGDPGDESIYDGLQVLPGGAAALVFSRTSSDGFARGPMRAIELRTGRVGATVAALGGTYVPEARALVYFAADGTVMAVPFDLDALEVRGRPRALFCCIDVRIGPPEFAIGGGAFAYTGGGANAPEKLHWLRRADGVRTVVDPDWSDPELESFALSPDGARVAITIADASGRRDVWIKRLDRGPLSRFTFGGAHNDAPSWSGDGRFVSYLSQRGGRSSLWRKRSDGVGAEELVADIGRSFLEARWSRDGAWLVGSVASPTSLDLVAMRIGTDTLPRPLLADPWNEWMPVLSPDGRWLAYLSNETGVSQLFVRPFPGVQDGRWQISTAGATDPVWSADGKEIFFRALESRIVHSVDMTRGPASAAVVRLPQMPNDAETIEANGTDRMFEVAPDGRRFLVVSQGRGDITGDLVIVLNFVTELRAALRGAGTP